MSTRNCRINTRWVFWLFLNTITRKVWIICMKKSTALIRFRGSGILTLRRRRVLVSVMTNSRRWRSKATPNQLKAWAPPILILGPMSSDLSSNMAMIPRLNPREHGLWSRRHTLRRWLRKAVMTSRTLLPLILQLIKGGPGGRSVPRNLSLKGSKN